MAIRLLCALLLLGMLNPAAAHRPSDAYVTLDRSEAPARLRIDVALRDAEREIGLDADGDGAVTWGELRNAREPLTGYISERITASAGGEACTLDHRQLAFARHGDGPYAVLGFTVTCAAGTLPDALDYGLFFTSDPLHRGLLVVNGPAGSYSAVLSPDRPTAALPEQPSVWSTVTDFVAHGVWHIWIGFDHLLFLAVLLLPAVAMAGGLRGGALHILKVVTAFTVAHSITLSLAVLGYISLPSGPVEVAIAASIVVAALANLIPRWRRLGWALAFAFGLLHGLGFAGVLTELGLPGGALAIALVSFNVGVELGQIAVVVAVLPLLYAVQRFPLVSRGLVPAGSMAAAAVASFWVMERIA